MAELFRSPGYDLLTPEDRQMLLNGCGPKGAVVDLVPDSILGVSIREACNIHDYDYSQGKTWKDKKYADKRFLQNMGIIISAKENQWKWTRKLRMAIARKYYEAVRDFGGDAYCVGKPELMEI